MEVEGDTRVPLVARICELCGVDFDIEAAQLNRKGYGRFCSRSCHYAWRRSPKNVGAARRWIRPDGYVILRIPGHHLADRNGDVYEHRLVAEHAIGRLLEPGEVVHHHDGNLSNNAPENLGVTTQSEHAAEHARQRSLAQGIDPRVERRCHACRRILPFAMFSPSSSRGRKGLGSKCRPCAAAWQRAYKARKREGK